jgi:hypothetical protein
MVVPITQEEACVALTQIRLLYDPINKVNTILIVLLRVVSKTKVDISKTYYLFE